MRLPVVAGHSAESVGIMSNRTPGGQPSAGVPIPADFRDTALVFPVTWGKQSRETFQRLADMGKMTQAEVDRVEARLQWFRGLKAS